MSKKTTAIRFLSAAANLAMATAFGWAGWRMTVEMWRPACEAAWPISVTAVLCGKVPSFLYGALSVAALEGLAFTLILAPLFLMGSRRKKECQHDR